jgi:hypothetical protein
LVIYDKEVKIMKKTMVKLLAVVTFGLVLGSSAMAGEDVDAFTLSFQSNVQELAEVDAVISKASFVSEQVSHNVLDIHYDANK